MAHAALAAACLVLLVLSTHAQDQTTLSDNTIDSLYIDEVESEVDPPKVLHAEPLYIDLIRDLGARKGEAEWNVAFELSDRLRFDRYLALIEFEWAVANRLGLELELPVTLYSAGANGESAPPSNRLESIKAGIQWTAFVRRSWAASMAFGYINELEFADLDRLGSGPVFTGNVFNPFVILAKRWGARVHSLIYTGPRLTYHFGTDHWNHRWDVNISLHYMLTGTRNFLGVETNSVLEHDRFSATIRPQMRLGITDHLLVGMGVSLPVSREQERLGMFIRLIWEPE